VCARVVIESISGEPAVILDQEGESVDLREVSRSPPARTHVVAYTATEAGDAPEWT